MTGTHALLGSGYESTEERAKATAKERFPLFLPTANGIASQVHRTLSARARAARMAERPAEAEDSTNVEYLYEAYDWTPHRIIKKTKTHFHLEPRHRDVFQPAKIAEHPEDFRCYAADRQKLETQGYARAGAYGRVFTEEGMHRYIAEEAVREAEWRRQWRARHGGASNYPGRPNCFAVLGLDIGATAKEVKRAFRLKSREAHPDGGGSHEQFIELRTAYDEALRYCAVQ